jgi:predicted nucleic acid-binding protein
MADFYLVDTNVLLRLVQADSPEHNIMRRCIAGVQVYDARLVAAMRVHRIQNLLTLNVGDFRRYDGISVVAPQHVLSEKP